MDIKKVLKDSWSEYTLKLLPLLITTGPFIIATVVAGVLAEFFITEDSAFFSFTVTVIILTLQALVTLSGIKFLYKQRETTLEISIEKIAIYLFAALYVGIVTTLGLVIFIIPGIIIMAVTFLMPIFILKDGQGPIESVASSAALVKDYLVQITLLLCGIWLIVGIIEYLATTALHFTPIPSILANGIAAALSLVIGLYSLTLMIAIYSQLSVEPTLAKQT